MRALFLSLFCVLAACGETVPREPTDYDAMNRAAEGPAREIFPEPIATGQLAELGVVGMRCVVPAPDHRQNFFAASRIKGVMRIDGEIFEFAPRPTLDPLPYGISDSFDGLAYTVDLVLDRDSETPAGPELLFYNGTITVRDARKRTVFEHRGRIECGA